VSPKVSPRPPERVRRRLEAERRTGAPFNLAWGRALRAIPSRTDDRAAWITALRSTEDAWRSAYYRSEPAEAAVIEDVLVAA
jgi:hypothetical protein